MRRRVSFILAILALHIPMAVLSQDRDTAITLPPVVITSVYKINSKIDHAFRKSFPNARNLHWYKSNKNYLAKFIKEDMRHQTLFKKNGYIQYDISYGYAFDLPLDVGTQVESVYKGYAITYVAKVSRYKQDFWIINLEGIKDFLVIRVENGDIEEVKQVEKPEG